jgi:hypothetical protein
MKFPTDQTWNGVPSLHARLMIDPVVWLGADPVGPARYRPCTMRSDQFVRIRAFVFQSTHGRKLASPAWRAENSITPYGSAIVIPVDLPANGITAKETDTRSVRDGAQYVSKHFYGPILVMANTQKTLAS